MKLLGLEITRASKPATRFMGELVKVQLSPGDVCVLMARKTMAPEETERVSAMWRAVVGDEVTLIVLDDGMKLGVLSPPQAQAVHDRLQDEDAVERAIGE